MGYHLTQVSRVENVTPHLVRITFGGESLKTFRWDGPDQRVKVFLPLPGQERPEVPLGDDWYARYREMPTDVRPTMRTYTIRGHDPATNEVQIEFVLHGDGGPASRWASRAQVGDYLGFRGPYADYDPVPDTSWQLLIGDETALPAIGGIIESLPVGTRVHAFVEVADAAEEQTFATKGDVALTWVHRNGTHAGESTKLADAVRAARLPEAAPYVWMAAEAGAVRTIRRHLVQERGIDRQAIYFAGYWRLGRREDDPHTVVTDDD